jgi:hypothetical protein
VALVAEEEANLAPRDVGLRGQQGLEIPGRGAAGQGHGEASAALNGCAGALQELNRRCGENSGGIG